MTTDIGKRLNKFISESGFCSRRAADKLIEQGQVTINDKVPELGTKVMPGDVVKVDGKLVSTNRCEITCLPAKGGRPFFPEYLNEHIIK